jgi:phospholipid/cholesterol/gamma-HCH transport system permease protein
MVAPMSASTETSPAQARIRVEGDQWEVAIGGRWRITARRPAWNEVAADTPPPAAVRLVPDELESWDSALVLFILEVATWCQERQLPLDLTALPAGVRELVDQLQRARATQPEIQRRPDFFTTVGNAATAVWRRVRELTNFVGECVLSVVRLIRQPQKFRWRDCLYEMQQCGAMSLPIVGLIAFLVGVTLAYTGAIILRQFGGDIWVADLVGLSMTREMGAMMTGIVLAGRTGAAYAAEIGNMKAGEELDALETLGIRPVDFLVIPRIIALVLMMPLLTLYAITLGIIGGMVIALGLLDIPPTAYWLEMLTIVDMSDLMTGMIKAVTFGGIVALSGCLRGLQADRSAVGVGRAATSAVVTSILLIVVADAVFAVVFNILGW